MRPAGVPLGHGWDRAGGSVGQGWQHHQRVESSHCTGAREVGAGVAEKAWEMEQPAEA